MEFILNLVDPASLPPAIVCLVVLFIVALKDTEFTQDLKISLLYVLCSIMMFMGWVSVPTGLTFLFLASFATIEFFTDDFEKKALFKIRYKLLDYCYRMICEYRLVLYVLSIIAMCAGNYLLVLCQDGSLTGWPCADTSTSAIWLFVVILALTLFSLPCTARTKFTTKNISNIVGELSSVATYSTPTKSIYEKFQLLASLEDSTFFTRDEDSHNLFSLTIAIRAIRDIGFRALVHPFKLAKRLFSRGYGTIEMQLIRNIGVLRGYEQCKIRRKFFEILYSNMIFNSYRHQHCGTVKDYGSYRDWIMWCYVHKVPVKFSRRFFPMPDKTTVQQVFDNDFGELSMEEFFVWCLGLEFLDTIGEKTLRRRSDIIENYGLEVDKINVALDKAYKAR